MDLCDVSGQPGHFVSGPSLAANCGHTELWGTPQLPAPLLGRIQPPGISLVVFGTWIKIREGKFLAGPAPGWPLLLEGHSGWTGTPSPPSTDDVEHEAWVTLP